MLDLHARCLAVSPAESRKPHLHPQTFCDDCLRAHVRLGRARYAPRRVRSGCRSDSSGTSFRRPKRSGLPAIPSGYSLSDSCATSTNSSRLRGKRSLGHLWRHVPRRSPLQREGYLPREVRRGPECGHPRAYDGVRAGCSLDIITLNWATTRYARLLVRVVTSHRRLFSNSTEVITPGAVDDPLSFTLLLAPKRCVATSDERRRRGPAALCERSTVSFFNHLTQLPIDLVCSVRLGLETRRPVEC